MMMFVRVTQKCSTAGVCVFVFLIRQKNDTSKKSKCLLDRFDFLFFSSISFSFWRVLFFCYCCLAASHRNDVETYRRNAYCVARSQETQWKVLEMKWEKNSTQKTIDINLRENGKKVCVSVRVRVHTESYVNGWKWTIFCTHFRTLLSQAHTHTHLFFPFQIRAKLFHPATY